MRDQLHFENIYSIYLMVEIIFEINVVMRGVLYPHHGEGNESAPLRPVRLSRLMTMPMQLF